MYINSHKHNTNDYVYDNLQNDLYLLMQNMAKNGNQAKVGGLGGDIGKWPSFNLIAFFPGQPNMRWSNSDAWKW